MSSKSRAPVSKEEYLKRYTSKPKGKSKGAIANDVKYISGDLPDSIDAFDERTKRELNLFTSASFVDRDFALPITNVRKRKAQTIEEEQAKADKAKNKAELEAKYALWNRGIDTIKEREAELQFELHEGAKPFARYADDEDLTKHQKSRIHTDDPMAAYFKKKEEKKKKKKKKYRGSDIEGEEPERPRYKGPEPPANRFNIWPGYRWDGVDRSNGFEKKIIDEQTRRKVEAQLAYKWGCEDM